MSTLVRWNPAFHIRPRRHFQPHSFSHLAPYWDSRVAMPIDVKENEDNYLIEASVPGFVAKEIKIEVEDGALSIRAEHEGVNEQEHEGENEQEHEGVYLRERFSGALERKLRLSKNINSETIEAELEHGVLRLTLHKVEEAKPKLIEIKVA